MRSNKGASYIDYKVNMDYNLDNRNDSNTDEDIKKKISEAGYSPDPNCDSVPEDLYLERLADWLNNRARIAFVKSQKPRDKTVEIVFELPYGGSFSQTFSRPDSNLSESYIPYEDFFTFVGIHC